MMSLMMTTVAGAAAIAIASVVHVRAPFKTFDVHSVDLLSNSRNSSVSIQIPEPPCAIIAVFAVSSFTYLHTTDDQRKTNMDKHRRTRVHQLTDQ